MKNCDLIKSCDRVRRLGEVFTPSHIVRAMCDLIPSAVWKNVDATFLEPTCGNGNFIIEILVRKLAMATDKDEKIIAVQSIYGIDFMQDNIDECKCRMLEVLIKHGITQTDVEEILDKNIICGDTLKHRDHKGRLLRFTDWKTGKTYYFRDMVTKNLYLDL